jgi:hypothetical protein
VCTRLLCWQQPDYITRLGFILFSRYTKFHSLSIPKVL